MNLNEQTKPAGGPGGPGGPKGPGGPALQEEIRYHYIGDNIYGISTPPVGFRQYLVLGDEKALLIDTGMGIGSLKEIIDQITSLPIILVNTHCHPDHAGGNAEFPPALINPAELDVFEKMATLEFRKQDVSHMPNGTKFLTQLQPNGPKPIPAVDGQRIDLGNRSLQLIFTPGHTHGSLCVYDEMTGTLFTGDNVQENTTALREWNASSVEVYLHSMQKIKALQPRRLLSGHMPNDNSPLLIDYKIRCAQNVLSGIPGVEKEFRGQTTYVSTYHGTSIEYTAQNIR